MILERKSYLSYTSMVKVSFFILSAFILLKYVTSISEDFPPRFQYVWEGRFCSVITTQLQLLNDSVATQVVVRWYTAKYLL